MRQIPRGYILTSAACTLPAQAIRLCRALDATPVVGDVAYGSVARIGQHSTLENASGRLHTIHGGTHALFVFGNRYAPDYYEGFVPDSPVEEVDLLARSGVIGVVNTKNASVKDPTRVRLEGVVCDRDGKVLNTRDFPIVRPRTTLRRFPRARMVLVCGTSMNAGKSMAAAACCRALRSAGRRVRAAKATGTAGLKDILAMNDAGAHPYADFSFLGYPSTYMLPQDEVLRIFEQLDLKYGNNPRNYWVVELADGLNQRETAMLLRSPEVTSRIHTLVFCARDAFSAMGALPMLKQEYDLVPDLLSGVCSSSPLHIRELGEFTRIPVFESAAPDLRTLAEALLRRSKHNAMSATA